MPEACTGAFEVLYDRHSRLCFSLAVRILGDHRTAEEVVEETFLSVWRGTVPDAAEPGCAQAWLCALVRTRAVDRLRSQDVHGRRLVPLDGHAPEQQPDDLWDAIGGTVATAAIRDALDVLPAGQRDIVELAYFAGYSQAEISEELRLPLETVRARTRSALRTLRAVVA